MDAIGLLESIGLPNAQLYKGSALDDSKVEEQYDASSDKLFNDRSPNLRILSEKPEHRIVCYLKAQGKSNKEIAELTGFTYPWVSQMLRQPWARQRILQLIKEAGGDEVTTLLQSTTTDSIYTLIDVRDDPKAKPAERTTAANALLDRVLGKPLQRVEADTTIRNVTNDVSEINAQLAGVEEELKRYGQN